MRAARLRALFLTVAVVVGTGCEGEQYDYAVTSTVHFTVGDAEATQALVSRCERSKGMPLLFVTAGLHVTSERHWVRFPDGRLLVLGSLHPCRWGPVHPPAAGAGLTLAADPNAPGAVRDGRAFLFDDATHPTQVELYSTTALFGDGAAGVHASGTLAVGGGEPSETLGAAFPWLAEVDAGFAARDEDAEPVAPLGSFVGYEAILSELKGGASCEVGGESGQVAVPTDAACRFLPECDDRPNRACRRTLGGVRPEHSATKITFDPVAPEAGYLSTLWPAPDLVPPGLGAAWLPELCAGAVCQPTKRFQGFAWWFPESRRLLEVRPVGAAVWGDRLLARRGLDPDGS